MDTSRGHGVKALEQAFKASDLLSRGAPGLGSSWLTLREYRNDWCARFP